MSAALQRAEARLAQRAAKAEKVAKMAEMYRQGLTLADIGRQYACTREYVRQLLRAAGINAADGGQAVRSKTVRAATISAQRQRQAKQEARFGVPYELLQALRENGATRAFGQQRKNSAQRGIEWRLTLAQWWAVWQASGKFHLRGVGAGKYCMSRIRDDGAYALGNVHVQLATENSREAVSKWMGKTKSIKGVFCLYPGRDLAWQAKVGKVSLGFFASAEQAGEARAAYMQRNGMKSTTGIGRGKGWTLCKRPKARPYRVQVAGTKDTQHATQAEAEAEYARRCAEVLAARQKPAAPTIPESAKAA
jgi:hypothetical protein